MKVSHFLLPGAALAIVIVWNTHQWRAVRTLEEQDAPNQKAATARRPIDSPPSTRPEPRGRVNPLVSEGEPLNWKSIARRLAAIHDGTEKADLRKMLQFQKRINEMNREEIIAALDEIRSLDADPSIVRTLEEMLAEPLIQKDPEYALRTFGSRLGDDEDGIAWQLPTAMQAWAEKDVAAATAWLDEQIAAGLFESKSLDGHSQTRLDFEAALSSALLTTNPEAASRRIAALPEEQRREALEQIPFAELTSAQAAAYVEMVRTLVPRDEHDGSFTHMIAELVPEGGFERVGAFLDSIQATPGERAASARQAANSRFEEIVEERGINASDVNAMRAWLETQDPASVDRVTGEALADAAQDGGEFSFEDAAALALEYHRQSGNDDLLISFLESFAARSNLEEAIPLANQIQDPAQREKILNLLN